MRLGRAESGFKHWVPSETLSNTESLLISLFLRAWIIRLTLMFAKAVIQLKKSLMKTSVSSFQNEETDFRIVDLLRLFEDVHSLLFLVSINNEQNHHHLRIH